MQNNLTHANNGNTRCGAKRRDGGKCTQYALKGGNGRCRMHNGRAKRGIEAPNYQGKGYGKYLPYPFADIYDETQGDEQLASVRDDIQLMTTFIVAALPNLETGESGAAWKMLNSIINEMEKAYLDVDGPAMAMGFRRVRGLINDRLAHYKTQDEILKTVDHRRKLIETEQKISLQGERAISVELFTLLIGAIFKAIEMGVKDKDERITVAADIRQLISAGN